MLLRRIILRSSTIDMVIKGRRRIIVGLGNPGSLYAHSRHNIGASVVKALGRIHKRAFKKERSGFALSVKYRLGDKNVILAIPLTFMNLSGQSVANLLKKYKVGLENLLVVLDDLDLDLGRLKLKASGSSAGHKGLGSIIEALASEKFARLRIGIGRPYQNIEAERYVLSSFSGRENKEVKEIIKRAVACCESWVIKGAAETMNIFNQRENLTL